MENFHGELGKSSEGEELRRKEKLWIAVRTDKYEHLGWRKVRVCSHAFTSKDDCLAYFEDLDNSEIVKIEVEL